MKPEPFTVQCRESGSLVEEVILRHFSLIPDEAVAGEEYPARAVRLRQLTYGRSGSALTVCHAARVSSRLTGARAPLSVTRCAE